MNFDVKTYLSSWIMEQNKVFRKVVFMGEYLYFSLISTLKLALNDMTKINQLQSFH